MENDMPQQQANGIAKPFDGKQLLLGQLPVIMVNAVLPFLIYQVMTTFLHQPMFISLVVTGIPSIVMSIVTLIRKRRIDFLAGIVLAGIVVGLILTFVSHDARLMLVRESFFTAALGLVFLISLLFPKPLIYYIGRSFMTENNPEQLSRFESRWLQPEFRTKTRVQTAILGVGLFAEAVVRCILVFKLPISQFLAISPFVQWGIIGATIAVLVLYRRRVNQ
ncbi:MAG TPA: VC0807 family protein [Dictyobacter sp.]|jgi:hypothetical protein|nr:VC0807 family protein [Dictyobacter sp.]